jgi:hypothetical protein
MIRFQDSKISDSMFYSLPIEHPCVFDIEVKPDIEHAAN